MKTNQLSRDSMVFETTSFSPIPYMERRNAEKRIMGLVALGNPQLLSSHLEESMRKVNDKVIGRLSGVPLTQAKYQGIALATLACRTAIDAGVPETIAYTISDDCVQLYDTMENSAKQWEIAQTVLMRFCEAVHTMKFGNYSPAVRKCCEYIQLKLHSNISLSELGEVCHLSPHYVSDLFRKELGIGALQYAHQIKLQYAKHLLESSELSIAEISTLLSYPSHSNFSQRFKKTYGVTPLEYRTTVGY